VAIPANLIKLIHEGYAQYKTYAWGYSNSGFLPVRNDKYIVIIGFKFWHFIDLLTSQMDDINAVWLRSVKQIRFRSRKSNNHFIIRQPIRDIANPPPALEFFYDTWGHTEYKDLYLVHEQDVAIDVVNSPSEDDINVFAANAPSRTAKPPIPTSFGTEATVPETLVFIHDFSLGGGGNLDTMETVPIAKDNTDTPGFGFTMRANQVEFPVSAFSGIGVVEIGEGRASRLAPLVDIQYIEIDKEPTERLRSSN